MEFKKCEHCGEQIHIRSKKCPFCNEIVEEVPIIIDEEVKEENNENLENVEKEENNVPETEAVDVQEAINEFKKNGNSKESVSFAVGQGEPKDYVYKAEVRHSIEYVEPMSNWTKVFLTALCTFPVIGQLVGSFTGVYFVSYEDADRKSFGKALIVLSIVMFFIYLSYVGQVMMLMENIDLDALYNAIGQ